MNLANRPGFQGGISGSRAAAGNQRAPVTDLMAETMLGAPRNLRGLQLRQQASQLPLLIGQLQAIPLLRALVELQPASSKSKGSTYTPIMSQYLHSSCTDRGFEFRKWFGIGLQTICRDAAARAAGSAAAATERAAAGHFAVEGSGGTPASLLEIGKTY